MQKSGLQLVLVCTFAFLGGFASDHFFKVSNSYADVEGPKSIVKSNVSVSHQDYVDARGTRRVEIDSFSEHPVQNFFGQNGAKRLELGLYGGTERAGSEAGMPYFSLSDTDGKLRAILRVTQTKNKAAVIVLKDSKGKDRLVMGTGLSDDDEDPFLVYIDKFGNKHSVFGKF